MGRHKEPTMPSPVTSREAPLYTPNEPEKDVCTTEGPPMCAADVASHEPESIRRTGAQPADAQPAPAAPSKEPASHDRSGMDYFTLSGGASAIIGGDVSLTLD